MDLFSYNSTYRLWICTACQYAVCPRRLESYLRRRHSTHPTAATPPLRQAALTAMLQRPWLDPAQESCTFPASSSPPVPGLPIFPGLGCTHCSYVCRAPNSLRSHLAQAHPETRLGRGGRRPGRDMESLGRPIYCQRFFPTAAGSVFFEIQSSAQAKRLLQQPAGMSRVAFIQAQANLDLDCDLAADQADDQQICEQRDTTEISPWLELTQWPKYLRGHSFSAVATLAALPHPSREPLLVQFSQSLTRLIDRAYQTIEDRRVNEFDQIRINSFLQRPGIWDRPIQIHLKPSTYQRYRQVWQRLICFAYRTSRPGQPIVLRHQLTTAQLAALDRMEIAARRLLHEEGSQSASQAQLDEACLAFSIALLDHSLKGDLFESTMVGFLAALGVDAANQTFHEPYGYTGYLSGLVKMGQMLVVEQAVQMADAGDVAHPADALDAMRERFLLHGVRAPFGWITRLRTYGKKVQNTTTSQGYIYWSEDEQTLTYKELRLTMTGLRRFIRTEMELAQAALEELFLLHEEETREDIVPVLRLAQLQDDPTKNARGWNFLQYPPNRAILATGGPRWLMNRVLTSDWLREEFVDVAASATQVVWRSTAVHRYLEQVDGFLERLLLLIHITAGQPGRATELLSLRHVNTVHGRHRNIFIENGLVSTVTAYHKGYSVSNSTKIIHRYLPQPVSELVVYYLWLVMPFAQNLERRLYGRQGKLSPFLWPRGEGSWDPDRLRAVLQREAQSQLQTKMNILLYRHAAIAISRVHLKCGGFKRDYGIEQPAFNEQASHGSWTAGTVYARGLQEAPGHVEARRRQYRAISREWHGFLGFEASLGPRKRSAEESARPGKARPVKRPCVVITVDPDIIAEYAGT